MKRISCKYTYDVNGNLASDELNRNSKCIYDYRNLLIELHHKERDSLTLQCTHYEILFYYDEAGNRIRKTEWKYNGTETEPIYTSGEDNPDW
jgi:uncharacterized protein RhaS with RHS repeats